MSTQSTTHTTLAADTHFGFIDKAHASDRVFNPALVYNQAEHTMLQALLGELRRAESFVFSVAFITDSALAILKQHLQNFTGRGVIYTSTYLDFNEPAVFEELLTFPHIEVRVLDDTIDAFHSKGYIFRHAGSSFTPPTTTAIVGSSNLTRSALLANEEWNLKFSAMAEGDIVEQLDSAIARLYDRSHRLTREWIAAYEARRKVMVPPSVLEEENQRTVPVGAIRPNGMQAEALAEIKKVQDAGERRALVISATGTGKTILAALAVRQMRPQRVLFVVHREQILNKAIEEFQKVLEEPREVFGKFVGQTRQQDRRFVFATIQTLANPANLEQIPGDHFDLVIIDEVHRAGAESYRRVVDYLKPEFLLGLTATPERSDAVNVYEIFDHNVPYEIRLHRALEEKMLVPFSYFGVTEYIDEAGHTVDETSQLSALVVTERVDYIVQMLEKYGHPREVHGLVFCSRNDEARELAEELNLRTVNGRRLRTLALTGSHAQAQREEAVELLEAGELDYLVTVDIFNEGIDIPCVNQVVMLRNTQSSIIFTQQLGRGLRKMAGKTHLRVIDFIGNYKNNFLIPIALFGDYSMSKDSIRKQMMRAQQSGVIAGVSSVSFDEISQQRVLESLAAAKMDTLAPLKAAFRELEYRLGTTPMRYDFARFDTATPTAFVTAGGARPTYWHFLKQIKATDQELTPAEQGHLTLFDREFLNGKRPHELLLMSELLRHERISVQRYREVLEDYGATHDDTVIRSVEALVSLTFFPNKARYADLPVATREGDDFVVAPEFFASYRANPYFARHIDDVIETGLYLNRHHYTPTGELVIEQRYSRKDVCRLLNWRSNQESTIYGYKADPATGTCPIFITYHKDDEIDDAIKYQDHLDDEKTLSWFTRHGKTLNTKLEREIIAGVYRLDIFVKKDDAEGTDFIYLGRATPRDARNATIEAGGTTKPIVNMKLDFVTPVRPVMYDYLTKTLESVEA